MVQRKAAAKAKQALNGVQKKGNAETPKKALRAKAVKEEELEVIATPKNKKGPAKTPVKKVPPPKKQEVQEASEDSDVEEDEADAAEENSGDEESEAESETGLIEKEAEESDDDDEQEDDTEPGEVQLGEDDSDNEEDDDDNEDDDDDDDAPEEVAIDKNGAPQLTKPTKAAKEDMAKKVGGIPNIATGKIPAETPNSQVIFVGNLPEKYKMIDLIEAVAEFGTIKIVDRVRTKGNRNGALIAYSTEEAAVAAIAVGTVTMNGLSLPITPSRHNTDDPKDRDARTIVISCIGPTATVEQLKEHFAECGEIQETTLSKNKLCPYGFVRFTSADSVPAALKLTNSNLNERTITVRAKQHTVEKNAECTIVLANTSNAESYSSDAIAKIFKKCGEIGDLEILCTKTTLAFITFKTPEAADKAYELNGTTVNGLELKLERYSTNRTVLITNLANSVTEDELTEVFAKTGEIEHVKLYTGRALIKFKTTDAFCKSFLLNEKNVNGKPIFLEPNSKLKYRIMSRPNNQQNNRGAPFKRNFQPGQGKRGPGGPNNNNKNNSFNNKNNSFNNKNNSFNNKNNSFNDNSNKRPGFNGGKRQGQGNGPNAFKRPKTA